jgi:hypothetical protein
MFLGLPLSNTFSSTLSRHKMRRNPSRHDGTGDRS